MSTEKSEIKECYCLGTGVLVVEIDNRSKEESLKGEEFIEFFAAKRRGGLRSCVPSFPRDIQIRVHLSSKGCYKGSFQINYNMITELAKKTNKSPWITEEYAEEITQKLVEMINVEL
ncbi:hypothetical protein A2442_01065 [Candidatus Campbellbacteria bacterium RIFOXYC2_FULL_35_25]|uniref:Uncharacterized protein n=1 Tax=Candidatus Campbellbacteria bacterium RIFOXYC2_FULL_35_25 TaxID=1797582 RepID=A0A1F5EJ30_9BACT|nr:MAG: hypothetical protein A2442_01065 [Candidatus Campbellbacteria bacterium RIFOXYC2_FULL_35_25]